MLALPKNLKWYLWLMYFQVQVFITKLLKKNKERYRENETKAFLLKVESLREDVDNLLDNQRFD